MKKKATIEDLETLSRDDIERLCFKYDIEFDWNEYTSIENVPFEVMVQELVDSEKHYIVD